MTAAATPAEAADGSVPQATWLVLAFLGILLALWLVARLIRSTRNRQTAALAAKSVRDAGLAAVLDVGDAAVAGRGPDDAIHSANFDGFFRIGEDPNVDFARLLELMNGVEGADLDGAVDRLCRDGAPFDLQAEEGGDSNSRRLDVSGRRTTLPDGSSHDVIVVRDATARHKAAEEERESKAHMRRLLENLDIPVWVRDRDLAIIDANAAYVRAVEAADAAQVIAEGREIASSAIGDEGRALARDARDTATPMTQNHHVVVEGARRYLAITETPVPGTPCLLGYAIDQTDYDETRGELARHIAAHGEVLEQLHNAVAIYGSDKRLKFYNSAFVRLWGLEGESVLDGEPAIGEVLEVLRQHRRLPEYADFPSWRAEQERQFVNIVDTVEDLMHLPDGRTLRTVTAAHPFGGLLFLYEDVTDRLTLERSYNTLTAVQRETLDNLQGAVAVVGADGRIKLFNPAFAGIWEFDEDYLKTEPHLGEAIDRCRRFLDTENWESFRERIITRITDRETHAGRLERHDGRIFDYVFVPLPDGAALLSYHDVTDSHRVEQALRERAEALAAADRLKTEFLANVSYELRTPLNTIVGFSEMLAREFRGPLNEQQKEYVAGILDSSAGLMSLINNVLDLAMIEGGQLTLERQPVDVCELLQELEKLSAPWVRSGEQVLRLDCPYDLGEIDGDARRLKQAMLNLVSNAVAFTPPGGSIAIYGRPAEDGVEIGVRDTGPGIGEEERERVFETFERGAARERKTGGLGLGLALVKEIVARHGGSVALDANPGGGTVVSCRLPRTSPDS